MNELPVPRPLCFPLHLQRLLGSRGGKQTRRQKVNIWLAFKDFLANADRGSTPLYVCGDFNFPDINWIFK